MQVVGLFGLFFGASPAFFVRKIDSPVLQLQSTSKEIKGAHTHGRGVGAQRRDGTADTRDRPTASRRHVPLLPAGPRRRPRAPTNPTPHHTPRNPFPCSQPWPCLALLPPRARTRPGRPAGPHESLHPSYLAFSLQQHTLALNRADHPQCDRVLEGRHYHDGVFMYSTRKKKNMPVILGVQSQQLEMSSAEACLEGLAMVHLPTFGGTDGSQTISTLVLSPQRTIEKILWSMSC